MMWEILPDGRGRRVLTPNPARQEAAAAKRARKAAKRASDTERTAVGRALGAQWMPGGFTTDPSWRLKGLNVVPVAAYWDRAPRLAEPNWRQRLNARRATGPVQR